MIRVAFWLLVVGACIGYANTPLGVAVIVVAVLAGFATVAARRS